jgi:thioredoxin reductase (NADPH)
MTFSMEELRRRENPVLTEREIDLLRPFGNVRATRAGEVLYSPEDPDYPLTVVLAGRVAVFDRSDGVDRLISTNGPGEFHGELGILNEQSPILTCIVEEAGSVLSVPPSGVREAIATIPVLSDLLITTFAVRRELLMNAAPASLTLIGLEASPDLQRLQEFVTRNRIPYRWLPPDAPEASTALAPFGIVAGEDVWVVVRGERALANPSNLALARALGLDLAICQDAPADVIIVGAGPAGLSAAVYAASEGLTTIAVDDIAIGGQAGTSSRIENYLGFPTGISGTELAFRAEVQALKFGARITVPRRATRLTRSEGLFTILLDDTTELAGRSVVIATGARYRRLELPNQDRFEHAGIYYAATQLEARHCRGADAVVIGGGNSAGQAAMFLAGIARQVHLVCRGPDLALSMSEYLIARLEHAPNVQIHLRARVIALQGDERLESVTMANDRGEEMTIPVCALFVMIGANPCTDWLRGALALDDRGFILTGVASGADDRRAGFSQFQTSMPGVYAAGDVCSGSVKRVASAVGTGSVVVQAIHAYLAGPD